MHSALALMSGILVIANLASMAAGDLSIQAPLTVLTFVVCLGQTCAASPNRVNPGSLLCLTTGVFLLGRFLVSYVFGWGDFRQADWFMVGPMDLVILSRALAAVCLFLLGAAIGTGKLGELNTQPDPKLGVIALRMGLLLAPFAVYRMYANVSFWLSGNYLSMYLDGGPGGLPYALGGWAILSVFAFLASRPARAPAWVAFMLGILLCAIETLKGARGIAMGQLIGLTWLFVSSQGIRFSLWKAVIAGLAMVMLADYVGRARFGISAADLPATGMSDSLLGFFFSQGVSLIFLVAMLENLQGFVPGIDGIRSTFALIIDNFHRLFGSLPAGQSEDFARLTASLAHRLAYMVNPEMYLSGMGMGGSAVAESLLYSSQFGPLCAGLVTGLILKLLFHAGRNSSAGLFVLASTFPFLLLVPRETQLYFLIPLIKASIFVVLAATFAKRHASN